MRHGAQRRRCALLPLHKIYRHRAGWRFSGLVQVGSHYHFFETNEALQFERGKTRGFRLNIPAGTAVRFEPGQSRDVELVAYSGSRHVYGFNGKIMGQLGTEL